MKRKVYVKQMKMLKEKSKTQEKEQQRNTTPPSADTSTVSDSNTDTSRTTTEGTTRPTSTVSTLSSSTLASTSPWTTTASTTGSNSGPLPAVDVLMRTSSLRAFQFRQPQEAQPTIYHLNDNRNGDNRVSDDLSTSSAYTNNRDHQDNTTSVERWAKDCSVVEQTSNIGNKMVHPSYGIEYPGAYNVNLDQTDNSLNEANSNRNLHSTSPVFHQLQVSRLNDKSINTEVVPHNNLSEFSGEHNSIHQQGGSHSQYDVHGSDSGLSHHQHHTNEVSRYNQNSIQRNDTNNVLEDNLQGHRGQVRTWEQENYRYVDFTWRHGDNMDSQDSLIERSTDEDDDSVDYDDVNVLDDSVDLSNKDTPPTTKSRSGSSGGRRRRKRVQTPVQRSAANMRERRRMCHLNVAFDYLKEHLPNVKDKKKLSRIQTLKAAIYYIHLLQDSLNVH